MKPEITTTNKLARQALAVGKTVAGGDVRAALDAYLRTPDGGWGETRQAWEHLTDAVYCAVADNHNISAINAAAEDLVEAAIAAGWPCHPSRRED